MVMFVTPIIYAEGSVSSMVLFLREPNLFVRQITQVSNKTMQISNDLADGRDCVQTQHLQSSSFEDRTSSL